MIKIKKFALFLVKKALIRSELPYFIEEAKTSLLEIFSRQQIQKNVTGYLLNGFIN